MSWLVIQRLGRGFPTWPVSVVVKHVIFREPGALELQIQTFGVLCNPNLNRPGLSLKDRLWRIIAPTW